MIKKLEKGITVSCQALPHEPLYGEKIMGKMALAALQAGGVGIRSNGVRDIEDIYETIEGKLPIIGLIKEEYDNSNVYITPTSKEVQMLIDSNCDVIALDATIQKRPKESLEELITYIKTNSKKLIMADISTLEEAVIAEKLGCDYISTTLMGYTSYTKDVVIPNVDKMKEIKDTIKNSIVVAEGGINTLEQVGELKKVGFEYFVIGGAITRPKEIAMRFVGKFNEESK